MSDDRNINIHVEGTEEAAHGFRIFLMFAIPLVVIAAIGGLAALVIHVVEAPSEVSQVNSESQLAKAESNHQINSINREESAQQRADKRVGASPLPIVPVKLTLVSHTSCLVWDSGYLDNGHFIGYIKNKCDQTFDYYQVLFSAYAPDGTIVQSGDRNTSSMPIIGPKEKAEVRSEVGDFGSTMDARVTSVKADIRHAD